MSKSMQLSLMNSPKKEVRKVLTIDCSPNYTFSNKLKTKSTSLNLKKSKSKSKKRLNIIRMTFLSEYNYSNSNYTIFCDSIKDNIVPK